MLNVALTGNVASGKSAVAELWTKVGVPLVSADVLALARTYVPELPVLSLKVFLVSLAIVDDIGAILVIAVFYSEGVSYEWLALAVASVVVHVLARGRIHFIGFYFVLGVICWVGLHEAHIHPTLAGVVFGMMAPVTSNCSRSRTGTWRWQRSFPRRCSTSR